MYALINIVHACSNRANRVYDESKNNILILLFSPSVSQLRDELFRLFLFLILVIVFLIPDITILSHF